MPRRSDRRTCLPLSFESDPLCTSLRAPSRPPPCLAERDACTACYQAHATDPLQCRVEVEAYRVCAARAHAEFVMSGASR